MFCRQCGQEINPNDSVCLSCGVPVGTGHKYCPNCGASCADEAILCVKCGCQFSAAPLYPPVPVGYVQRSRLVAGLLGILLGALGIHNFYTGYTNKGIIQVVLTVVSCGTLSFVSAIWGLVEGIMFLTGSTPVDGNGYPLKE